MNWFPYALFLKDGDIVFLPRDQAKDVARFAEKTNLEIVDRTDIWSPRLDPFLDTEVSDEYQARSLATLAACSQVATGRRFKPKRFKSREWVRIRLAR